MPTEQQRQKNLKRKREREQARCKERIAAGLCVRGCAAPPKPGTTQCVACLERRNPVSRELKHYNRTLAAIQGRCQRSGCSEVAEGKMYCDGHAKHVNKLARKLRVKRQKMGLCACGDKLEGDYLQCPDCRKRAAASIANRTASGICQHCPNAAAPNRVHCPECLKKLSERAKSAYWAGKKQQVSVTLRSA